MIQGTGIQNSEFSQTEITIQRWYNVSNKKSHTHYH